MAPPSFLMTSACFAGSVQQTDALCVDQRQVYGSLLASQRHRQEENATIAPVWVGSADMIRVHMLRKRSSIASNPPEMTN